MAKVMKYAMLMLTLASLAAGCRKGGGVLEVSENVLLFPASGGVKVVYSYERTFNINSISMYYTDEELSSAEFQTSDWLHIREVEEGKSDLRSMTVEVSENADGIDRKCRVSFSDGAILYGYLWIIQYAD